MKPVVGTINAASIKYAIKMMRMSFLKSNGATFSPLSSLIF
jgi:hypothetical protein